MLISVVIIGLTEIFFALLSVTSAQKQIEILLCCYSDKNVRHKV